MDNTFILWLANEIKQSEYTIGNDRRKEIDLLLRRLKDVDTIDTLRRYASQLNNLGATLEAYEVKQMINKLSRVTSEGLASYKANRKAEDKLIHDPRCIPCKVSPMIRGSWLQYRSQDDIQSVKVSLCGQGRELRPHVRKPTDNHDEWDIMREAGYVGNARTRRRRRGKGSKQSK